jgi:hypothetical protein
MTTAPAGPLSKAKKAGGAGRSRVTESRDLAPQKRLVAALRTRFPARGCNDHLPPSLTSLACY